MGVGMGCTKPDPEAALGPGLSATMQRAIQLKSQASDGDEYLDQWVMDRSKPKPSPPVEKEIVVRLRMRPVNTFDVLALKGSYKPFQPEGSKATPGLEGMGEVEAIGEGVTQVEVGARVVPLLAEHSCRGEGSWQEYVKVTEDELVAVPDELSDEVAAQCVVDPWTAVGLVDTLQIPPGEFLLQTAAGTSLGRQLIQYAHYRGIKTINVIRRRSEHLTASLRELGADEVVTFEDDDLVAQVMAISDGRGVWGAAETGSGPLTQQVSRCVREHGTVLVHGALGGWKTEIDLSELVFRDVRLRGFHFMSWFNEKYRTREEKAEFVKETMRLYTNRVMVPLVGDKYGLSDYRAAVEASQKLGRHAKVLLVG